MTKTSAPAHGMTADLRIADLPEDLRPEGERLKVEYHALAMQAGLLNEEGEFQVGKLDDISFVEHADLAALTRLATVGDALAELANRPMKDYRALSAALQKEVPLEEFRSPAFVEEAASHGFSPYQWAGVRTVVQQSRGRVTPATFAAEGKRALTVAGDLDLYGCRSLTTLPDNLSIIGELYLRDCISLKKLPDNLTVTGSLDLRGCSTVVREKGKVLKAAGKIQGRVLI